MFTSSKDIRTDISHPYDIDIDLRKCYVALSFYVNLFQRH